MLSYIPFWIEFAGKLVSVLIKIERVFRRPARYHKGELSITLGQEIRTIVVAYSVLTASIEDF